MLRLKRRAARRGRSAEAEARDILLQILSGETEIDFDTLAAELRALTGGRRHTPAEEQVREARGEPAALAIALLHPASDCANLAPADSISCDFVTADRRLAAMALLAGHGFG